ncbi:MAG: hypothetical protein A2287_07640 [Candidatus Melainabacteria bacterium RIFOXYA12_FULL_32_12]|nr:MAG: hypothetical protein A2255_07670 [Candidatus Melainabacteria bacterium RIFOXYA2_FULL_32_9]OGI30698.1 MAG: hypothetical protein A2287_07640 [Candidatus Melainabacteria bacterium RIFOXYA12_FULL_32_12]
MDKKELVELLLEKKFGTKNPAEIKNILEINIFESLDDSENPLGIGVEIILEDENGNEIKEEYQINKEGVIYSWGNAPVIDERSLEKAPKLD